jgi:uncharacterized protein YqgV (UPF0045/DUF77 family)
MDIGVEISLYPLCAEYLGPIRQFIARLNTEPGLRVETNSMSTQVFGPLERLLPLLNREIARTFAEQRKAVFVMKVLGPLATA